MNDIRNWSSSAAMKLFTTKKHNTIEWPKMHIFAKWNIQIFPGIHPRISILSPRRFAPRPPLVANRNLFYYRTWNICVVKRNISVFYYSTLDIGVGKLHLPLPRNNREGMGGYTQPTWKQTKSIFKCIAKIHALECKAYFLENYF